MRKILILMIAVLLCLPGLAQAKSSQVEQQRAQVRKAAQETLNRLYKARPTTKAALASAAGYAVFTNLGVQVLLAGGGGGHGLAKNNRTGQETFMKVAEVQAGLGLGVKKFRVIFVFETEEALNHFVNSGWEFGGQSTAAAKYDRKGEALQGAVSVMPGVWMMQLTDKGLALEITGKGSKYYKDHNLN